MISHLSFSQSELHGFGQQVRPFFLGDAFGVARGVAEVARPDKGFRDEGDAFCFAAMNFHRTDVNRDILASITVSLECLTCDTSHSFKDSSMVGVPVVVILSDQAFPAILLASHNKCLIIVRGQTSLLN